MRFKLENIFRRIIPIKESKKKINIDYEISVKGDEFTINFTFILPKTWYTEITEKLSRIYKKDINLLNYWEADARILKLVKNRFWNMVKQVENDVKKDLPNFKIIDYKIKKMAFRNINNKVLTEVEIRGLCTN